MSRIVSDNVGDYDLAHVISITQIPQQRQISQTEKVTLPSTAKLHFNGGTARDTLLPYKETREAWLAVKAAEGHPVDLNDRIAQSDKPS